MIFVFMGNPTTYKGNTFTWEQGRKLVGGVSPQITNVSTHNSPTLNNNGNK